ncbi:MAG: transglycosylase domain-containing protein [Thermoleophilaceae bacterium]|nr:transglycosylase domain-containing protein [Thermoleophilaceae bacterium]
MNDPTAPVAIEPAPGRGALRLQESEPPTGPPKPKLKKLRLFLVIAGLGFIALISTIFGMMMAVSTDLPELENTAEFKASRNSVMRAEDGSQLARLTGNNNRVLVQQKDISSNVKNAVIAIEDRRFYQHRGVDYRGIARALGQDVLKRRAAQGASTITQQFVKNATEAADERTVLNKLRESALAYHLEKQWSKQKILSQYLNSVYFGNGAYGIESAVRTYFPNGGRTQGKTVTTPGQTAAAAPQSEDDTYDAGERAAANVTPAQAALLAAVIASPSAYDPVQHPVASKKRRDLALKNMLEQNSITRPQYDEAVAEALPTQEKLRPPQPISKQPYFSTWVTQQLVDRYGAARVFSGGLDVRTTIDPELQKSAEQAISQNLNGVGPSSSLVAIENKTGEVKALVGGNSFRSKPFNLATNGHRQPGSSFKPFILIEALRQGIGPGATFTSKKKIFPVPGSKKEKFVVNNYESNYSGVSTLANATAQSDNSVYAELGLKVGTKKVARLSRRMGIETKVSTNPAMTLGGLKVGVTPLEMAYAYSTIANKGERVSGTLGSRGGSKGPVAIEEVRRGRGGRGIDENRRRDDRIFPEEIGTTAQNVMAGVIKSGTAKNADLGEFAAGKTGTTENYGDAWFVGFNAQYTVAVWVGYANKLQPMKTEYRGGEVAGGTFPTDIWKDFMTSAIKIRDDREAKRKAKDGKDDDKDGTTTGPVVPVTPTPAPSGGGGAEQEPAPEDDGGGEAAPRRERTPAPEPEPEAPATPAPAPAPAPTPGTGGGGAPPAGT